MPFGFKISRLSNCFRTEVKRSRMDVSDPLLVKNQSEKTFTFDDVQHLDRDHNFRDGTIRTSDGGYFRIHRHFLCTHSAFLYALFSNKLGDTGELSDVTISMISAQMMDLIINFLYGRMVEFSEDNVMDILFIADLFQVDELVEACSDFLISHLRMSRAVPVLQATELLYTPVLTSATMDFFLNSFPKMYENQREYRYLTVDQIERFLRDDHLNASSEDMTGDIVLDWVRYDPDSRATHLARLLRTVRFGIAKPYNPSEIKALCNKRLISSNPDAVRYLQQVHDHLTALHHLDSADNLVPVTDQQPTTDRLLASSSNQSQSKLSKCTVVQPDGDYLTRPRVPPNVLFAVGGWSAGRAISVLETYDCRTNTWYMCTESDTCPRAYLGVVVLNNRLYVAGGFDGTTYYSCSRRFDPLTGVWSSCSHMTDARCYVSMVAHKGKIYALGGYNGTERLKSCEVYDPDTNQWTKIASMNYKRSDADATVLGGKVYVAGGFTGEHVLRSMERYDPGDNTWVKMASMEVRRSGVSLVSHGEHIYALGGFDGTERLKSVERYNPSTDAWRAMDPMKTSRSNFFATEMDGYIYAVGGFDGKRTTNLCERYDPSQDTWTTIASMNIERSALAGCVFRQLKNRKHYTSHGQALEIIHSV